MEVAPWNLGGTRAGRAAMVALLFRGHGGRQSYRNAGSDRDKFCRARDRFDIFLAPAVVSAPWPRMRDAGGDTPPRVRWPGALGRRPARRSPTTTPPTASPGLWAISRTARH